MTGNKALLTKFEKKVGPQVSFGDNNKRITKGYGLLTNGKISFEEVAYVACLKHNLLSISPLCDKE
ncbi:hypothetical protein, partial [Escherichia coli]|uniref:hypothetical protein n=1 Tax=Escherichia coli TaxID=562 RepID=UPI001AA0E04D